MSRDMGEGSRITMAEGRLSVPDDPVVHYIEGDGIGIDITPVMMAVVDAAVERAYDGKRSIRWSEALAGQKAFDATGEWLPCLLYTSPSPRDYAASRMPSSA